MKPYSQETDTPTPTSILPRTNGFGYITDRWPIIPYVFPHRSISQAGQSHIYRLAISSPWRSSAAPCTIRPYLICQYHDRFWLGYSYYTRIYFLPRLLEIGSNAFVDPKGDERSNEWISAPTVGRLVADPNITNIPIESNPFTGTENEYRAR